MVPPGQVQPDFALGAGASKGEAEVGGILLSEQYAYAFSQGRLAGLHQAQLALGLLLGQAGVGKDPLGAVFGVVEEEGGFAGGAILMPLAKVEPSSVGPVVFLIPGEFQIIGLVSAGQGRKKDQGYERCKQFAKHIGFYAAAGARVQFFVSLMLPMLPLIVLMEDNANFQKRPNPCEALRGKVLW